MENDHGPNGMPPNYHADQVNLNVKAAAVAIDAKNENVIYAKMPIKVCQLLQ